MNLKRILVTEIRQYIKKINEASFHNFNKNNILTDQYIRSFLNSHDGETYLDWYIQMNGLDEDDSDNIRNSEEYIDFVVSELERNLEEAMENIYDKIDYETSKITIYRAMTVDNNWIQHLKAQGKRLGIYWSWDETGAVAHWGRQGHESDAIIEAVIDEKYVNWPTTLIANTHPNFKEEKEITLFKHTPIEVTSIKVNGEEIDLSVFGGKIFTA